MALIDCLECGRQISDKAESCPGCGAPMRRTSLTAARPKRVSDLTLEQQAWIEAHKKSKGVAVLLAILLTGAANLYAGQIAVGIIFLFVEFVIFVPLMFVAGIGFLLHFVLAVIALATAVSGIDKHNASLYTDLLTQTREVKTERAQVPRGAGER